MEPNKEHIHHSPTFCFVFIKKKYCAQNYLWNVWWKCYSHRNVCEL